MYCHHCGKKRTDDAVYCSQCGRLLAAGEDEEEAASAELAAGLQESISTNSAEAPLNRLLEKKDQGRRSAWVWVAPSLLAVVSAAAVFTYYMYQEGINDKVLRLQNEAKAEALSGKYAEALAKLEEAAEARPGFAAVRADLEIVSEVAGLEQSLSAIGKQLDEKKLDEAEQSLQQAKEALAGRDEPVYAKAKERLETYRTRHGVMKISAELGELLTVDELEAKLNAAKHLDGEQSDTLRKDIVARIVELCYEDAMALLNDKNYNDALAVTARALAFSKDDERLTELEKRIEKEQKQYEQAERQRLEQAMQKAAEEDLKNQTAAVEVVNIVTTLDEFGDLYIEGELKNAATRPIYSISVQYTVYGAEGSVLGTGSALATPDYVEPGETMGFTGTVYGVYEEGATVVVDHATWYLD
ncbi:FxLYD domain-containing protein [Paenibacillus arenilitoris]|uniref:Zinc-ribbon domain-containing protein n=1 Tax=Paenibacillus arenilitoris TaxID=2772299 RepID=A0A927CPC8_9BACL|nr:FxLYD domain-containing protein [Paenibacillus arenilitoris]MBD2871254.1 zinc-ribbon domain-containing protein [Paenibacillus arenilitoris]